MALYKSDYDFNDCELPSGQYIMLFPAILLIASYRKTRNSQSKESRNQNPTYGIYLTVHLHQVTHKSFDNKLYFALKILKHEKAEAEELVRYWEGHRL